MIRTTPARRTTLQCSHRTLIDTWASTLWPFSSSTRNIAFGSGSTTVPSTSIASSFVMLWRLRQSGQDLGAVLGDRDGVLEVGGEAAVGGDRRPVVLEHAHLPGSRSHHGLDGQDHPGLEHRAAAGLAEIRDLRLFMQLAANAVAHERPHD